MKPFLSSLLKPALLIVALFISSCSPTISSFDQTAYTQVTAVKVDALALMDKATDDYSTHAADIAAFQLELDKAIEYDKHRPRNTFTNKQWAVLVDPKEGLLIGFLMKWKKDGKEKAVEVTDVKVNVGLAFDQILELESGKAKPKE